MSMRSSSDKLANIINRDPGSVMNLLKEAEVAHQLDPKNPMKTYDFAYLSFCLSTLHYKIGTSIETQDINMKRMEVADREISSIPGKENNHILRMLSWLLKSHYDPSHIPISEGLKLGYEKLSDCGFISDVLGTISVWGKPKDIDNALILADKALKVTPTNAFIREAFGYLLISHSEHVKFSTKTLERAIREYKLAKTLGPHDEIELKEIDHWIWLAEKEIRNGPRNKYTPLPK